MCAGADNNFYVTGTTTYDSLATPGALQTTKVSDKPSGIIARFTSAMSCPNLHFEISEQNNQLSVDSGYATYQWYNNGNLMQGENQNQLILNNNDTGSFYVHITDSCGCGYASDTVAFPVTGMTQLSPGKIKLKIYPNPGNGHFTLSGKLPVSNNKINYRLTDITGRTIQSSQFHISGSYFKQKFDFSYLPDGLYLLHIQGKRAYGDIKFIKKKQID